MFLGSRHSCGANGAGYFTICRRSVRKRVEARLRVVQQAFRARMHAGLQEVGGWLQRVVTGFSNYHRVPGNLASLRRFRERAGPYRRQASERRSQRGRRTATRLARLLNRWRPRPRLMHPYPAVRFDANHPRQEPHAVVPLVRICAGLCQERVPRSAMLYQR